MSSTAEAARFEPQVSRGRIALLGAFGSRNLGNDETLSVTIHELRSRCPSVDLLSICAVPQNVASWHGVRAVGLDPDPVLIWRAARWRPGWRRNVALAIGTLVTEPRRRRTAERVLEGVDHLVLVGTGMFDDLDEYPWTSPAWLLRWIRAAKRVGARVTLLAVGVGPIVRASNRVLMLRAIRLADRRIYRDQYSLAYLRKLGIDVESDEVVPDLVFAREPIESSLRGAAAHGEVRRVGVGVMGYYGWQVGRRRGARTHAHYLDTITDFSVWLLERGIEVRLLSGQVDCDEATVGELLSRIRARISPELAARLFAEPIAGFEDLEREIVQTDIVVAARFHNVICALINRRPVVATGYAGKFDALMRDVGLSAYCQTIETLDLDRLKAQFEALAAEHTLATRRIDSAVLGYRRRLQSLFDSLLHDVEPPRNSTQRG